VQTGQALKVEIDRAKQQKEVFAKQVATVEDKLKKPKDTRKRASSKSRPAN